MNLKTDLKNVKLEFKIGAGFGIAAFFFSLVVGMMAGNSFLYSFGRGFLFSLVFIIIGVSAVKLVRKYIPEIAELDEVKGAPVDVSDSVEIVDGEHGGAVFSSAPAGTAQAASGTGGEEHPPFEPLKDHLQSIPGESLDGKKSGNLGKHVLKEKAMRYEPKIAAEAIRTLMSKDQ